MLTIRGKMRPDRRRRWAELWAVLAIGGILSACAGGTEEKIPVQAETEVSKTETAILHPFTEARYQSDYDEKGRLLASAEYLFVGIHDTAADDRYTELAAALNFYNAEREKEALSDYASMAEAAKADAAVHENFAGYTSTETVDILRADEQVFSYVRKISSYTGGAHGNTAVVCRNFSSEYGRELVLSDIVTDQEALLAYLTNDLEARFGSRDMLFPDWEETVANGVYGGSCEEVCGEAMDADDWMHLNFALSPTGMEVYFEPYEIGPYALGTVMADVPYSETSVGFKEAYIPRAERSVWKLDPHQPLLVDLDGHGAEESVSYQVSQGESAAACTLYISQGDREVSETDDCGYGVTNAYLMKDPAGGYWFLAECRSDNDWRYLNIKEADRLWAGTQPGEETPFTYGISFYENVPVSSRDFDLATRGSLISTTGLRRRYGLGADGTPQALEEDYQCDTLLLTAKQDVPAASLQPSGGKTVIPKGTVVKAVSTDDASYVIFQITETGEFVRVEIDGEEWPRTIQRTAIEEYFDGLIFAG